MTGWIKRTGMTLTIAVALALALTARDAVSAHVLIVDQRTKVAAVFHTNPDDDPIAGETSELYFDIQDKTSDVRIPYSGYELVVRDEAGNQSQVPVRAAGSTVIAEYVFPAQGLYELTLRSQPQYRAFQEVALQASLRVSRSAGVAPQTPNHAWASAGLAGGLLATAMLAILFLNNRRETIARSRW